MSTYLRGLIAERRRRPRDSRRFSAPDVLDLRRADARNQLSFGGGIDYCVG